MKSMDIATLPRATLASLIVTVGVSGLCGFTTPAAAADGDPASATVSSVTVTARPQALDKPVATGSRLALTSLETPASVEIVSGEVIRDRGDFTVQEAIARTTGVIEIGAPGNGGTALAARGFSGQGSVMTLYDGLRLYVAAGTITFPFDPWTVDSVQVLRGPASVLYGEGAIGGAVNVIPRRPGKAMQFDGQVGVGSRGTYRLAAGTDGPVGNELGFRVDASRVASNGQVDRGDSESLAISGSLVWEPTSRLSIMLSHDYGDQEPEQYFGTPLIGGQIRDDTRNRNYNVLDSRMRFTDAWTQLRTTWKPNDAVTVRNVLFHLDSERRYRNVESYAFQPVSGLVRRTNYIAIGHDQDQVGNRLDVTINHGVLALANTLVVGVEFNDIDFLHTNNSPFGGSSLVDPATPQSGGFIDLSGYSPRFRTNTEQAAVFLEDRLILTDRLSLVGGLRYDTADFERVELVTGQRFGANFKNLTGRIGAVFQPVPTLSIYGQFGTGTDPLGSLITSSLQQTTFDNATGRQFEVGLKQVLMGGRIEYTLAAYDILKKNLLSRDPLNPALTQQIGARGSRGLEASAYASLGAGWSVEVNGTVLEARFEDFRELVGSGLVSRAGKTPPGVPEETANAWLNWNFLPAWRAAAGVRYVGKRYVDNANTLIVPSYEVVDLDLRWNVSDRLTAHAGVRNAFDKVYAVTGGLDQRLLGTPRTFELRLTAQY